MYSFWLPNRKEERKKKIEKEKVCCKRILLSVVKPHDKKEFFLKKNKKSICLNVFVGFSEAQNLTFKTFIGPKQWKK